MRELTIAICALLVLLMTVSCGSPDGRIDNETTSGKITTVYTDGQVTDSSVTTNKEQDTPITVDAPELDEYGVYLIRTADDLLWLSDHVNNHNSEVDESFKVRLENDIDMSEYSSWTPIGCKNATMFRGEFDGNGKTVSGIRLSHDGDYIGFFGVVYNGVIKDLALSGSEFNGGKFVAGICASNSGTIINCTSNAVVSGNGTVGGICAVNYGTVENCTNTGKVTAVSTVAGGICGYSLSGSIKGCTNTADVECEQIAGGISGYDENGAIIKCENTGGITAKMFAGGICGRSLSDAECTVSGEKLIGTDTESARIFSCINRGNVSVSEQYAGGICAHSCYLIEDCTNYGIVGSENSNLCAGICAYAEKGAVYASSNTGVIVGVGKLAGIASYTDVPVVMCSNTGDIEGVQADCASGGICVNSYAPIISCLNYSKITGDLVSGICVSSSSDVIYNVSVCDFDITEECGFAMIVAQLEENCLTKGNYAACADLAGAVDYGTFYNTSEECISNGETAHCLSSYSSGEYLWGQNLDEDDIPTVTTDKDLTVYMINVYYSCDAEEGSYISYSNVDGDIVPEHSYEDGICTGCGAHEQD